MISTKGRYALRVMIDIARHPDEYVSLKDISSREDISVKYLEQIASLLVKNGLLIGLRGSKGGYRLKKSVEEYTVFDILNAAEGTLAPVSCLQEEQNPCKRCDFCTSIDFWTEYQSRIREYLSGVSLLSLVENAEKKATKHSKIVGNC